MIYYVWKDSLEVSWYSLESKYYKLYTGIYNVKSIPDYALISQGESTSVSKSDPYW